MLVHNYFNINCSKNLPAIRLLVMHIPMNLSLYLFNLISIWTDPTCSDLICFLCIPTESGKCTGYFYCTGLLFLRCPAGGRCLLSVTGSCGSSARAWWRGFPNRPDTRSLLDLQLGWLHAYWFSPCMWLWIDFEQYSPAVDPHQHKIPWFLSNAHSKISFSGLCARLLSGQTQCSECGCGDGQFPPWSEVCY